MMTLSTRCCVAGGGPAGMMLGLLLARAGVEVVVLEKHADFLRDFRGDTIHPSTLEVVHELGLLESLLALPHTEVRALTGIIGGERIPIADFGHLPVRCPFVAFMPQWDFLDFLAGHAQRYPGFALRMRTGVVGLLEADGRVIGVRATAPDGPLEIRADLVVGADGRDSTVRAAAGLGVETLGAPMDVLWFRLPKVSGDAAAQTEYVLNTIKSVIETAGGTMADVTFNSIFITDWTNYAAVNSVYARYFPGDKPARYCIQCGLVKAEALVEIATVAHVGKKS